MRLGAACLLAAVLALTAACGSKGDGEKRGEPQAFTLTSATISLPADAEALPAGPHADLVEARCTACHSAGMILTQPALSAEQWKATVTKMREVYKADVPAADEPAILAYLDGLSAAKGVSNADR